jgi:hypothetical protein
MSAGTRTDGRLVPVAYPEQMLIQWQNPTVFYAGRAAGRSAGR